VKLEALKFNGRLSCRLSVPHCIDIIKKQSGTLRLHRRYADIKSNIALVIWSETRGKGGILES
jgi:hypothetical protein